MTVVVTLTSTKHVASNEVEGRTNYCDRGGIFI